MDLFDVIVVVAAAFAALGGWRLGFFTRLLSWVGLAAGVVLAARFLPRIVTATGITSASSRLVVGVVVVLGAALVGQAAGALVGARLPRGPLRGADRAVGAATGALGVLVALWLLLPAVSSVPGWPARATRRSAIARWMSASLPPPPNTLRNLVDSGGFPQVFSALRPGEVVGSPPAAAGMAAATVASVAASTVQVQGQACNRIQDGSGFAVAPDLILTNAHVVAGEPAGQTAVIEPSGRQLPATVVFYDPNRDIALLSVAHLGEAPLQFASGAVGTLGAVFGHPNGQTALAVQPARVAQEITAVGEDLYNRRQVSRDVYVLASNLAPGDSGGALVDRTGKVVGVAFAIALDRSGTAYALTSKEVLPDLSAPRHPGGVSTQSCVSG